MSVLHQQYLWNFYQKKIQDLLSGAITSDQLVKDLTDIHLNLEKRADFDGLIEQFYNLNGFTKELEKWLKIIKRLKLNGTLLALDIDQLKRFNDTLGHVSGDTLIKLYAQVIDQCAPAASLKGRLGGDEFAIFVLGIDTEEAKNVAEGIRTNIIQKVKEVFTYLAWEQTISIGIAQMIEGDNAESLRSSADKALYNAKEKRNSIVSIEIDPEKKKLEDALLS